MARKILNRKDLRADFDAAEARKEDEEVDEEEEDDDEEDDDEEEEGEPAEGDEEAGEEPAEGDEDEEEAPKKKKKVAKVKVPKVAKPRARSRAAKIVRMRQVWGVFNNSNVCVTTFEYPRRQDAVDHAAKLTADKRSTHFVQPVKEAIEEKKEEVVKEVKKGK